MFVARTDQDAPKHQGLTYFIMDMEQDAVQVRPLRQITGEAEFNELFIEEARIPDENVVGGVGNGWGVAITTLMHERAGARRIGRRRHAGRPRRADRPGPRARRDRRSGDPQKIAQLTIEVELLRLNAWRGLTAIMKTGIPGPEGSVVKWQWGELNQSLTELAVDILGEDGALWDSPGPTASCAPAPTRSKAGPPRSSRTSWPSGCSAFRSCASEARELRLHRRSARHQAHGQGLPGRALHRRSLRELAEGGTLRRLRMEGALRAGLARHLRVRGERRPGARRRRARDPHGGAGLRARARALPVHGRRGAGASDRRLGRAAGALAVRHRQRSRCAPPSAWPRTARPTLVPDAEGRTSSSCWTARAAACWRPPMPRSSRCDTIDADPSFREGPGGGRGRPARGHLGGARPDRHRRWPRSSPA